MKAVTFHEEPLLDWQVREFPLLKHREKHFNLIDQFVIMKSSTLSHCFLPLSLPPSGGAGGGIMVRAETRVLTRSLRIYRNADSSLLCPFRQERCYCMVGGSPLTVPPGAGPPDPGPGSPAITHPTWYKGNANVHTAF